VVSCYPAMIYAMTTCATTKCQHTDFMHKTIRTLCCSTGSCMVVLVCHLYHVHFRPQQVEILKFSLATYRDLIPVDPLSYSLGSLWHKHHHYVPVTLAMHVASNWITSAKLNWETCVMNTKFLTFKKLWRYNNELWSKLDWHQNTEILQNLETRRPCVVAPKWSKGTTTGHEGL